LVLISNHRVGGLINKYKKGLSKDIGSKLKTNYLLIQISFEENKNGYFVNS